jgi:hypothetical protein
MTSLVKHTTIKDIQQSPGKSGKNGQEILAGKEILYPSSEGLNLFTVTLGIWLHVMLKPKADTRVVPLPG